MSLPKYFYAKQIRIRLFSRNCAPIRRSLSDYPFTYRLADLIDLLKEKGVVFPEDLEELRFLTPFAVVFRYELYEEEEESFDSDRVATLLTKLREWTIGNLPPAKGEESTNTPPPQVAPEQQADDRGPKSQ